MRGECSAMRFSPARLPFSRPENEASRREPKQSRMPGEQILFIEDAIGQVEYCAKVGPNFARENSRGSGGSDPPLSAIESFSVCNSARDDRNTWRARPISHNLWQRRTLQTADSADLRLVLSAEIRFGATTKAPTRSRYLGMLAESTSLTTKKSPALLCWSCVWWWLVGAKAAV